MKDVKDTDLIFWLSEAEILAGYINDHALTGNYTEMSKAVNDFRTSTLQFNKVLEEYKNSKVVNPKILKKGLEFSDYCNTVLDKCYTILRENLRLAEVPGPFSH